MLFADKVTRSVDANIVRLRAEKKQHVRDAREAGKKPAPAAKIASQARLAVMLATGAISQEVFDATRNACPFFTE